MLVGTVIIIVLMLRQRRQALTDDDALARVLDQIRGRALEPMLPHSAPEMRTFAGLFPNANYAISHNLLTRNATPGGETLARQDREALKVVEAWMNDPRFEMVRPRLQEIANRLQGFVGKRKNGP